MEIDSRMILYIYIYIYINNDTEAKIFSRNLRCFSFIQGIILVSKFIFFDILTEKNGKKKLRISFTFICCDTWQDK